MSPIDLTPSTNGREKWLRANSDARSAVVDADMWVDFSGTPRPLPTS